MSVIGIILLIPMAPLGIILLVIGGLLWITRGSRKDFNTTRVKFQGVNNVRTGEFDVRVKIAGDIASTGNRDVNKQRVEKDTYQIYQNLIKKFSDTDRTQSGYNNIQPNFSQPPQLQPNFSQPPQPQPNFSQPPQPQPNFSQPQSNGNELKFCIKCGAKIQGSAKFCPKCGEQQS